MSILFKPPNLFITGGFASGKTTVITTILDELISQNTPDELGIVLVNNGFSLIDYEKSPYLITPAIQNHQDFPKVLDFLGKLAKKPSKKPILVVINDWADICILNENINKKLIDFCKKYQPSSNIHFIIEMTTSGNEINKWLSLMNELPGDIIFLRPSQEYSYDIFPYLKNLPLTPHDEPGHGYYYDATKKRTQPFVLDLAEGGRFELPLQVSPD